MVQNSGDQSRQDCIDSMLCHLEAKPRTRVSVPGGRAGRQDGQATDVVCQAGTSQPPWSGLFLLLLSHLCAALIRPGGDSSRCIVQCRGLC